MNLIQIRSLLKSLEVEITSSSDHIDSKREYTKELFADLSSLRDEYDSVKLKCTTEFPNRFQNDIFFLDFIIYQHVYLFLLLTEHFFIKEESFKHIDINSETFKVLRFFCLTLCNLTNSLLSIRLLIENGFNLQAKQLTRSYIEYADISIAMLAKDDFFNNYKSAMDSDEKEKSVWWNYTRPKALNKILKDIFNDIHEQEGLWELFNEIRGPIYSNLSDHVHAHFMANAMSALSQKSKDSNYELTLMGAITEDTNNTLRNVIAYSHIFIRNVTITLIKCRELPFIHFEEDGEKFVVIYKMGEIYMPYYLKKYAYKESF